MAVRQLTFALALQPSANGGGGLPLLVTSATVDLDVASRLVLTFNAEVGFQGGGLVDASVDTSGGPEAPSSWNSNDEFSIGLQCSDPVTVGGSWQLQLLVDFVAPDGYTLTLPQTGVIT